MPGERFHVRLVPEEGGGADRVVVEVGLEGFNIMTPDGRTLRKYPLHHISRWSMRGSGLILFTKSPADLEDRTVTLQGDEHTIRSLLDTLTCSCMQMAELLESGAGAERAAANSLNALLKKSKKPSLPTADQVEFWKDADKQGWMYSQGEHIKTWRKRWFVLKQGFLFRFASPDVAPATKPRGVVDLSSVTDVSDGHSTTGRPHSVQLTTAIGSKCYLTENETGQVEWISALEGAVAKILKVIAGVEEEAPAASGSLAEQLVRSYDAASAVAPGAGAGAAPSLPGKGRDTGNGMVRVVNYEAAPSAPAPARPTATAASGAYGGMADYGGYVGIDYSSVAGAQVAPSDPQGAGSYGSIYSQPQAQAGSYMSGVYEQQGQVQPPPGVQYPQHMQQQQYPQHMQQYQQYQQAPPQQAPQDYQQQQPQQVYPDRTEWSAPQSAMAAEYGSAQSNGHGVTLLDAVTAPQAPPSAPSTPWQVHYTADGRPYYYNTATGITTWDGPSA